MSRSYDSPHAHQPISLQKCRVGAQPTNSILRSNFDSRPFFIVPSIRAYFPKSREICLILGSGISQYRGEESEPGIYPCSDSFALFSICGNISTFPLVGEPLDAFLTQW